MKNLTVEEQEYLLKHLKYDLRIADGCLKESIFCSTDTKNNARNAHKLQIPKYEARIEFLTNLISKL